MEPDALFGYRPGLTAHVKPFLLHHQTYAGLWYVIDSCLTRLIHTFVLEGSLPRTIPNNPSRTEWRSCRDRKRSKSIQYSRGLTLSRQARPVVRTSPWMVDCDILYMVMLQQRSVTSRRPAGSRIYASGMDASKDPELK